MAEDSVDLLLKGREVVMVCQAASQTRFRALKHENGIAGSATIIVRVIACFQPLQDCQVSLICFLHNSRIVISLFWIWICLARCLSDKVSSFVISKNFLFFVVLFLVIDK